MRNKPAHLMKTQLTRSPQTGARHILNGGVVAFPTETVYGLGANVFDEKAVRKIFAAKRRPSDNPLIAHISDIRELRSLVTKVTPSARKFIDRFFPGPLTIVLPKRPTVPKAATGGLATVGVRMPKHPVAHAFLKACGVPIVAPSANISGSPSPTRWQSVFADLDGRISCIIKGGQTRVGLESTVVDCTGKIPHVLRSGAVSLEQLQKIVPSTRLSQISDTRKKRSPGTRYRHYSPKARVIIVATPKEILHPGGAAYIGLEEPGRSKRFRIRRVCANTTEYAHALFAFFRSSDTKGVSTIYCQSVQVHGIGLALMDRLTRASR